MTTSTYNAGGQLTGTDASGTLTTFTYDASGNLAAEVTSAGTRSYTWDYDDRLTDIEYPDSSETNYTYNFDGQRLTKVRAGRRPGSPTMGRRSCWSATATMRPRCATPTRAARSTTTS